MNNLKAVRDLVSPSDPLSPSQYAGAVHTPESQALLERIVSTPRTDLTVPDGRTTRKIQRRRIALGTAMVTSSALIAGCLVIFSPGFGDKSAQAATPPVLPYSTSAAASAQSLLERIASSAESSPQPAGMGQFRYVRTEEWALNSAVAQGKTTSVLTSHQSEFWRQADGSGRSRTGEGVSLVDLVGSTETLDAALTKPGASDKLLISNMSDGTVLEPLADLSNLKIESINDFARYINPNANTSIPSGALGAEAVQEVFSQQSVPPKARAQIWRMMATVPGITDQGEITDRVGRHGVAVTVDDNGSAHGLPMQYMLIIDPSTGKLLEYDEILTTDPGKLNVKIPAVLQLTVFLADGYTNSVTVRPQG